MASRDLLVAAESRYVVVLSSRDLKEISRVRSRRGYVIIDSFGSSLDAFGDRNGDGHPDFLVGADESLGGFFDQGYAEIYSGRSGERVGELLFSHELGVDVANAGRINEDGVDDVALVVRTRGNPGSTGSSRPLIELRLLSGKDSTLIRQVDLAALRN